MNRFILFSSVFIILISLFAMNFPEGTVALGVVFAMTTIGVLTLRQFTDEKEFITRVFLIALALRLLFGAFIHIFELQVFFGGDSMTYHQFGESVANVWWDRADPLDVAIHAQVPTSPAGWGMSYFVGAIYFLFGVNFFAAQSICAIIGAATAPMVYFCANNIYENKNTAKFAAMAVAVFPPFVIWSAQLLKDGLIVFLLVLAMTMVLVLQTKLNYFAVLALLLSMFGIIALRFYIFYMVAVAVAGSFVLGFSATHKSLMRNAAALIILGIGLAVLGIGDRASRELDTFASLERIQMSRLDLARSADTGYGEQMDVSTTTGALMTMPIGFVYLMLAPFPWHASNLRQAITIPDVLAWWAMLPFGVYGLMYTLRHRLRKAIPILIFTVLLTLSYSVFQGNVGTAYRQRTQIQVFIFVMIAVGWNLRKEQKENERLIRLTAQQRVARHRRAASI
jgi:4-amino-4-deoxy-L-arabinose transferase-like glycosyltransferase